MKVLRRLLPRSDAFWRTLPACFTYPLLLVIWVEQLAQTAVNLLPRSDSALAKALGTAGGPRVCPNCDLSVFWAAAKLAITGNTASIYDPARFQAYRQTVLFARIGVLNFFYPPPALLVIAPLSLLRFGPAFYAWTLVLTGLAICLLRLVRLPWFVIAFAIFCPAALWNAELGQLGTIFGAVLVYSLLAAAETPGRAGLALSLLIIKPQEGLLAPIALLASRRWRATGAAILSGAVILLLTTVIFGWPVWRAYVHTGLQVSQSVLNNPSRFSGVEGTGVSVLWMSRSFGADTLCAYVTQVASAMVAVWLTVSCLRRPGGDPFERMALVVFLSLLITPYGYVDDMVGFSIALTVLAWRRQWRIDLTDMLGWTWPTLCPLVFLHTGLVLTPLVVATATVRLWIRAGGFAAPEAKMSTRSATICP